MNQTVDVSLFYLAFVFYSAAMLVYLFSFWKKAGPMILAGRLVLFAGFIVSLIFIPLMVGAGFLTGGDNSLVGQIILFVLGGMMIFIQYTVGYIFSAMTVYLIYGYLAEGDGVMSKAWAIVKREWLNILSLAAASTAVNLVKNQSRGKGRSGGRNFLAGLIDTVWTEAAFLILPAMVIEDINLKDALKRVGGIIKNNLLLVGAGGGGASCSLATQLGVWVAGFEADADLAAVATELHAVQR